MLQEKIAQLLNDQINKEFYSAYLYLDFANYFEDEGLDGFAHWYEIQAQEERDHAMMIRKYLLDNGHKVTFEFIAKPDKTYKNHLSPLEEGLNQLITLFLQSLFIVFIIPVNEKNLLKFIEDDRAIVFFNF